MNKIIQNILSSLNNNKDGYSGKKLTIMSIVGCIVAAHVKWIMLGDFTQLDTVLAIDFGAILTLFGVNVADKKLNPVTVKEGTPDSTIKEETNG